MSIPFFSVICICIYVYIKRSHLNSEGYRMRPTYAMTLVDDDGNDIFFKPFHEPNYLDLDIVMTTRRRLFEHRGVRTVLKVGRVEHDGYTAKDVYSTDACLPFSPDAQTKSDVVAGIVAAVRRDIEEATA